MKITYNKYGWYTKFLHSVLLVCAHVVKLDVMLCSGLQKGSISGKKCSLTVAKTLPTDITEFCSCELLLGSTESVLYFCGAIAFWEEQSEAAPFSHYIARVYTVVTPTQPSCPINLAGFCTPHGSLYCYTGCYMNVKMKCVHCS